MLVHVIYVPRDSDALKMMTRKVGRRPVAGPITFLGAEDAWPCALMGVPPLNVYTGQASMHAWLQMLVPWDEALFTKALFFFFPLMLVLRGGVFPANL